MNTPPSLPRPRWILAYSGLIAALSIMYFAVILTTQHSSSEVIRSLTPLRSVGFAICGLLMAGAFVGILRRRVGSRILVVSALLLHGCYIVIYNYRLIFRDGRADPSEIIGSCMGVGILGSLAIAVAVCLFTKSFTNYCGRTNG